MIWERETYGISQMYINIYKIGMCNIIEKSGLALNINDYVEAWYSRQSI